MNSTNDFPFSTFLMDYLFLFVYRNFSCNTAITFLCLFQILSPLCNFNCGSLALVLPFPSVQQTRFHRTAVRKGITFYIFFSREVDWSPEKLNYLIKPIDQCFLKFLLRIIRYEAGIIVHTYTWFNGQISLGKTECCSNTQ